MADRLTGPFNVEMIIHPLDISISDAIMNFQESGLKVTQRVFEKCGTPRLVTRSAASSSQSRMRILSRKQRQISMEKEQSKEQEEENTPSSEFAFDDGNDDDDRNQAVDNTSQPVNNDDVA